jgi:hypothetical protein
MIKLIMAFMTFHGCLATDLYCFISGQTFTVGQPHSNVTAHPGNNPDTAWADSNDCSPIRPLSGVGNFINYDVASHPFYLWF